MTCFRWGMSHNWARESVCSTSTVIYNLLLVMKLKKTKILSVWCIFLLDVSHHFLHVSAMNILAVSLGA